MAGAAIPAPPAAAVWRRILWLCALLLCSVAVAEETDPLYEAVVPVAGYDAAARDAALSVALSEVLVRVSGDQKAPQHPALARVVQNAQRLVQRFSYETAAAVPEPVPPPTDAAPETGPDSAAEPASAPPPAAAPTLMLRAIFDASGVSRVLHAAGFAVWEKRQQTLLWLAFDSGTEQMLVGSDPPAPLGPLLAGAVQRRDLPLLYPLFDLEDQQAIQFSDVADAAVQRIRGAAARYQPDAILAGHVRSSAPDLYEARWTLYLSDTASDWNAQGSLQQVIDAGIDGAADLLVKQPAATSGNDNGVLLQVTGITDLNRFADVERYLSGISVVEQLQTKTVEPTTVTYVLQLSGTAQALQETLARGALLVPEASDPADPMLRYRIAQ